MFYSKRCLPKDKLLLEDIDITFDGMLFSKQLVLDEIDKEYLRIIDKSILSSNDFIDTPFSSHVSITLASTGVKILILAHHFAGSYVIDITEAGKNVIDILFKLDGNFYYSKRYILPRDIYVPVRFNNRKKICNNLDDYMRTWKEWKNE